MKIDKLVKGISNTSKNKDISKVIGVTAIVGVVIGTGVIIASKISDETKSNLKNKVFSVKESIVKAKKGSKKLIDKESINIFDNIENTKDEVEQPIEYTKNDEVEEDIFDKKAEEDIIF